MTDNILEFRPAFSPANGTSRKNRYQLDWSAVGRSLMRSLERCDGNRINVLAAASVISAFSGAPS